MTLPQHYHAAQSLSPKAARLAARLLDRLMNVPFEWRLSLRMALLERGRASDPFSTSELVRRGPVPDEIDELGSSGEARTQEQALRFIHAIEIDSSSRAAGDAQ